MQQDAALIRATSEQFHRAFSPAEEIWDYLRHCVAKYELSPHPRARQRRWRLAPAPYA